MCSLSFSLFLSLFFPEICPRCMCTIVKSFESKAECPLRDIDTDQLYCSCDTFIFGYCLWRSECQNGAFGFSDKLLTFIFFPQIWRSFIAPCLNIMFKDVICRHLASCAVLICSVYSQETVPHPGNRVQLKWQIWENELWSNGEIGLLLRFFFTPSPFFSE